MAHFNKTFILFTDITENSNITDHNSSAVGQNTTCHILDNSTNKSTSSNEFRVDVTRPPTTTVKNTVKPLVYKHIVYEPKDARNARQIGTAFYGTCVALIVVLMILADGVLSTLYKDAQKAKLVDPALMGKEIGGKKSLSSLISSGNTGVQVPDIMVQPSTSQNVHSDAEPKVRRKKLQKSTPPVNPADLIDFETMVTQKYGAIPDVISDMEFLKEVQIDIKRYKERTKPKVRPKSVIKRTPEIKQEQFREAFDKALDEKSEDQSAVRRIAYIYERFRLNPQPKKPRAYLSS